MILTADMAKILYLTVADFKRLRKALRVAASYGIPDHVVLEYALAQIQYRREHADRMRCERRAS